jgi:hypothetical protein
MKSPIVTVAIVIVVAIIAFFIGCSISIPIEKPQQKSFAGAEKHEVTLADAEKYIQNFRKIPQTPKIHGGSFQRAILDKILAQPDCDGIRIYYAQKENSSSTFVLMGITAKGTDMAKGTIADMISPCPPFCGEPE